MVHGTWSVDHCPCVYPDMLLPATGGSKTEHLKFYRFIICLGVQLRGITAAGDPFFYRGPCARLLLGSNIIDVFVAAEDPHHCFRFGAS